MYLVGGNLLDKSFTEPLRLVYLWFELNGSREPLAIMIKLYTVHGTMWAQSHCIYNKNNQV